MAMRLVIGKDLGLNAILLRIKGHFATTCSLVKCYTVVTESSGLYVLACVVCVGTVPSRRPSAISSASVVNVSS